jgi:hypothetical protein
MPQMGSKPGASASVSADLGGLLHGYARLLIHLPMLGARPAVLLVAGAVVHLGTSWGNSRAISELGRVTPPARSVAAQLMLPPPAPTSQLRVAVISDLNGVYGSIGYGAEVHAAVRAIVDRVSPDVVLITGDMVAGQRANLPYARMWAGFHRAVTDPLRAAGIPLAPAPGNHDASGYAVYSAERAEYARQWASPERMPSVSFVDREGYPFRYSFSVGNVFFVALDATMGGPLSAEQRAWVDGQLGASTHPVKIGYGHLPLHPVARGRTSEVLADAALEALFTKHGLTAYLSGHHHAYYPGAAGGFLQVAMPCLGGGPRPLWPAHRPSPKALVVIDIDGAGVVDVEAYEAPAFDRKIPRETLPERIAFGKHLLLRDDVAGLRPTDRMLRAQAQLTSSH